MRESRRNRRIMKMTGKEKEEEGIEEKRSREEKR